MIRQSAAGSSVCRGSRSCCGGLYNRRCKVVCIAARQFCALWSDWATYKLHIERACVVLLLGGYGWNWPSVLSMFLKQDNIRAKALPNTATKNTSPKSSVAKAFLETVDIVRLAPFSQNHCWLGGSVPHAAVHANRWRLLTPQA
eukprot:4361564-Amphidinium_carterae.1